MAAEWQITADLNVIKNSQLACMTRHAQITEQENSKP